MRFHIHRLVAVVPAFVLFAAAPAWSAKLSLNQPQASAFDFAPLSVAELSEVRGSGIAGVSTLKTNIEGQSAFYGQQVNSNARVALDNWWGQTGAALVANNLLAR